MANKKAAGGDGGPLKYDRVPSAGLKSSRKGRHHELMAGILNDLETLPNGSAVQIPLSMIGGLSIAKLRSAIVRATNKEGTSVETSSDDKYFYLWKPKAQR